MEARSIGRGVGFSTTASMLLGIIMAIIVVIEKRSYSEPAISLFLYSAALWCTLGIIFGFLGAVLIGIPASIFLNKVQMFKPTVTAFLGAGIGYLLGGMSLVSTEPNPYIRVIFLIYGAVGSLAFWYGASSNKASQPTPKNGAAELKR